MFWIALAAQIAAPVPGDGTLWFRPDDTPVDLLIKGTGLWQTSVRLTVTPEGTLQSCDIEKSSGIRDLDNWTCKLLLRRAKFQAARIDGAPTFGVFRTSIIWAVADAPWDTSKMAIPDIEVSVRQLPAGLASPTYVRVMFVVDEAGAKSSCTAEDLKTPDRKTNHPALVPVACEQVLKLLNAAPVTDRTGKRVVSVQNARVRFSAPE